MGIGSSSMFPGAATDSSPQSAWSAGSNLKEMRTAPRCAHKPERCSPPVGLPWQCGAEAVLQIQPRDYSNGHGNKLEQKLRQHEPWREHPRLSRCRDVLPLRHLWKSFGLQRWIPAPAAGLGYAAFPRCAERWLLAHAGSYLGFAAAVARPPSSRRPTFSKPPKPPVAPNRPVTIGRSVASVPVAVGVGPRPNGVPTAPRACRIVPMARAPALSCTPGLDVAGRAGVLGAPGSPCGPASAVPGDGLPV